MSLVLETEKPVIRLLAWQVYCDVSLEGTPRMSTASTQVLTCYRGDTSSFSVEIVQNGEACDITGHTLSWIISKAPSAAKLLQIDVTDHSDPAVGESVFEITAAMIETIGGHGTYYVTSIDLNAEGEEVTRGVFQLQVLNRVQRT